jgi:hypothetical protein
MKTPGNLLLRSFLALAAAGVTYIYGFWTGQFLSLAPTSEMCTAPRPRGTPPMSWTLFPLSNQCRWADGTSTDLVPWYVNPILFVCLATAVVCVVLAIRAARRHRTPTP